MRKEKVLVISTFPPKGTLHEHKLSAVASYCANTLDSILSNSSGYEFEVLADKGIYTEDYFAGDVVVRRVWSQESLGLYFSLLRKIVARPGSRKILFEFEWSMFGSKKYLVVFLPIFLAILRLMGKKVYFISHAVLLDAGSVSGQLGAKKNSPSMFVLGLMLKGLYFGVLLFSYRVVCFEEDLRKKLLGLVNFKNKVVTIPHGVEPDSGALHIDRKKLFGVEKGERVIMVFGFLIWYKGSDWICQQFLKFFEENPDTKLKLYLVGGFTPKYVTNPSYMDFMSRINEIVEKYPDKITVTGFIAEGDISKYYALADLVVFPYRVFVSSSGPLSFAFSFNKPVLLSKNLINYTKTQDFSNALSEAGLLVSDLFFDYSYDGLFGHIDRVFREKELLDKLSFFSRKMSGSRSWMEIGKKYVALIES